MFKYFLIIPLFFLFTSNIMADVNEEQVIKEMLESRDAEIKDLIGPKGSEYTQEQRDRLKEIINGVIDFRSMAQFALGDTYNEISEEDREEFVELFSTIIRDNSLNRLDIYRADVVYEDISVDGSEAHVKTIAQLEDVRTPVDYDMEMKDGEWVITDMAIDGVSTAGSYNRQYQNIIRRHGFDALLDSLRKRAARA